MGVCCRCLVVARRVSVSFAWVRCRILTSEYVAFVESEGEPVSSGAGRLSSPGSSSERGVAGGVGSPSARTEVDPFLRCQARPGALNEGGSRPLPCSPFPSPVSSDIGVCWDPTVASSGILLGQCVLALFTYHGFHWGLVVLVYSWCWWFGLFPSEEEARRCGVLA